MDRKVPGSASMLVLLYAAAFVSAFNENIVNVALVDIMGEFSVSAGLAQWLVTGYMIVTSIVVTVMAFLSRRFTFRRLFFVAAGCLVAGEAVCMLAPSFALLLASRLVQAVGSGVFIPLMMMSVLILSPAEKMGSRLAVGSAAITLGPAFAPVLSGMAATWFGWRAIFFLPGVITLVLAGAALGLLKNMGETRPAKLDALSLALSAVGLTLFVYGLGELASNLPLALGALAVAVAAIAWFVHRQGAISNPMLDMAPIREHRFSLSLVLTVIAMMTTFSMSVLLPLFFEGVFSFDALVAGLLILPPIVVNALAAVLGGRVMDKRGPWPLIPIGFALIVAGQAATAVFGSVGALMAVVASSAVVYAGVGLVMSPSQTAGLKALTHEAHASGVSIINTMVMVAASFGPSLFIGILSSTAAGSQAAGASIQMAQAAGFSSAVWVAAALGAIGLAVSVAFTWVDRRAANPADSLSAAEA